MTKFFKIISIVLILLPCCQAIAFSETVGHISGKLFLDDTWDRNIYVSFIDTFEKEYSVSNNLIVTSAMIDGHGNFKVKLDNIPTEWSLLRLHIVKKGVSPNSLVIGGMDENYYFLIATRDSEIRLSNTEGNPIFENAKIEGAPYMTAFDYVRKLSQYPNTIAYENSLIEKEFIEDVVYQKLKVVADTCKNPLVSLYALSQSDFPPDYDTDPKYFDSYLSKWEGEDSTYFNSFRLKFPVTDSILVNQNLLKYILFFGGIGIIMIGVYIYRKRRTNIDALSIQERKILDLVQKGLSNKEISAECNIELTTVKTHVGNIYSKLKIKSRKEAYSLKLK